MCWGDSVLLFPREQSCFETFRIKLGRLQFSITLEAPGTNKSRTKPLRRGNTSKQLCWWPQMGFDWVTDLRSFVPHPVGYPRFSPSCSREGQPRAPSPADWEAWRALLTSQWEASQGEPCSLTLCWKMGPVSFREGEERVPVTHLVS